MVLTWDFCIYEDVVPNSSKAFKNRGTFALKKTTNYSLNEKFKLKNYPLMLILYFALGAFILGGGAISLTNLVAENDTQIA